jgi:hypothetical protein
VASCNPGNPTANLGQGNLLGISPVQATSMKVGGGANQCAVWLIHWQMDELCWNLSQITLSSQIPNSLAFSADN